MKLSKVEKLYWHDGVISGFQFLPNYEKTSEFLISVHLFKDPENTSERQPIEIKCKNVKRFLATCNIFELKDNSGAGNILDGWVTENTLFIHLFGGLLEIEAKKYIIKTLTKCSTGPANSTGL